MHPAFRPALFTVIALVTVSCSGGARSVAETTDPSLQLGKKLFGEHCSSCHALTPGTVLVGPSLDGVASRAQENAFGLVARTYLDQSIRSPGAVVASGFPDVMPSDFGEKLTEEQLTALLEFLLTLE